MSTLNTISDQFGILVRNLVKGHTKRAQKIARHALEEIDKFGMNICMQDAIENLANEQALRSGLINSPSIFPGIGTIISFLLLGTENFIILEQGVKLSLVVLMMNGFGPDDDELTERVIRIIGEAYELVEDVDNADSRSITKQYITKVLPPKYLSKGFNRILSRIFPTRNRILKLLPVFGVFYAAIEGYSMTVRVGQVAVKSLKN